MAGLNSGIEYCHQGENLQKWQHGNARGIPSNSEFSALTSAWAILLPRSMLSFKIIVSLIFWSTSLPKASFSLTLKSTGDARHGPFLWRLSLSSYDHLSLSICSWISVCGTNFSSALPSHFTFIGVKGVGAITFWQQRGSKEKTSSQGRQPLLLLFGPRGLSLLFGGHDGFNCSSSLRARNPSSSFVEIKKWWYLVFKDILLCPKGFTLSFIRMACAWPALMSIEVKSLLATGPTI